MPFSYYNRLSARQQVIYRKSDAIESVVLSDPAPLFPLVDEIAQSLHAEDRARTQAASQALLDGLAVELVVPQVRVSVLARRPELRDGELHGLYEPAERGEPVRIKLWMRTVHHKRVVAFRTFLRTLLHEFCHHLDYERFELQDSFHTEGFYKRESSLLKQLLPSGSANIVNR